MRGLVLLRLERPFRGLPRALCALGGLAVERDAYVAQALQARRVGAGELRLCRVGPARALNKHYKHLQTLLTLHNAFKTLLTLCRTSKTLPTLCKRTRKRPDLALQLSTRREV